MLGYAQDDFSWIRLFRAQAVWQFACARYKKPLHNFIKFIFFLVSMSLGYELVVFASSYKFIKFILAWRICNRAVLSFQRADPIAG
jgi:hypothetical protein